MESNIIFERIYSIKLLDKQQVYDLEIEGSHNFIANDIIAHNTVADVNDFVLQNSSGGLNLVITNPQGNLLIKGSLNQNQASPLSPTLNAFIVQNSTGRVVAYVNSTGSLFLTETLTENVLFS